MRAAIMFLLLALAPLSVQAQVAEGNSCATAGQTAIASNTNNFLSLLYCNGTLWMPSSLNLGASVTTCNSGNAGVLRLTAGTMQFCDGTGWQIVTTTTAVTGNGYFVLSNANHDGNLGGLSGANASCRSELSAGSWQGKPGTLDTSKVFAFLCDASTCQNLLPNTQYFFARVGDTSVGGDYFITDKQARGPNDNAAWTATTIFNSYAYFWAGRGSSAASKWNTQPAQTCSGFTSNSSSLTGRMGNPNSPDANRWDAYNMPCNYNTMLLLCFVNP